MKFINANGKDYSPTRWLSFNDVLLRPQRSSLTSRNDPRIDLSTSFIKILPEFEHEWMLKVPVISANMDKVTEQSMANAMHSIGGLGILHRFYPSREEYVKAIEETYDLNGIVAFSIGCQTTNNDWVYFVDKTRQTLGLRKFIVCVDVAHGHMEMSIDTVRKLRTIANQDTMLIIAGNVATGIGAVDLAEAGADVVKVGCGCGSICSTRLVTGVGVPQLSAIMEVRQDLDMNGFDHVSIIADGGVRHSGDIVKALAAGADAVMLGQMLAGTTEAPGDIMETPEGTKKKMYRGQSSRHFLDDQGKKDVAAEGVYVEIPFKGSVHEVMKEITGGIRSGLTYNGAADIIELREKAEFIEITQQGWIESTPHALLLVQ